MLKIGLMGGTFNPIHNGHLILAEEVRCHFQLDKVIFIPTGNPPHKKSVLEAEKRYRMTELAIEGNEHFIVSDIETKRKGFSYTIDTLHELKEEYPEAKFYFIMGADSILSISTWRNVPELMRNCEFIAAARPGYPLDDIENSLREMDHDYVKRVHIAPARELEISSSDIRDRLKKGQTVKYLLPDSVLWYIKKEGLYCNDD